MTRQSEPPIRRSPFRPQGQTQRPPPVTRLDEPEDHWEPPYEHRSSTLVDVLRILAAFCFVGAVITLFQKIMIAAFWGAAVGLGLVIWAAILDAIQEIRGIARRFNQNH